MAILCLFLVLSAVSYVPLEVASPMESARLLHVGIPVLQASGGQEAEC